MNVEFDKVLARYKQRMADEDAVWKTADPGSLFARRDEFLLSVGEDVARFLHTLTIARRATTILELGTSYGYSTLFLADAARQNGGKLLTLEIDEKKQDFAKRQISDAGLGDYVEWLLGDATAVLPTLTGPFDLVLIDLWKELYVPCFDLIRPKMAENGVIAADNMIEPAMARSEARAYRAAVRSAEELQSVLLPIGSGFELSCVWRKDPY